MPNEFTILFFGIKKCKKEENKGETEKNDQQMFVMSM